MMPVPLALPDGVTVTERADEQARYLFVMNTLPRPATVEVHGYELLTQTEVAAPLTLPPYGVAVLRQI